ncbi:hypothetical protein HK102_006936 [Quaeritorhiza haematococci]|nr:hypothetical protein HK102_006936 [Quaeritorhiza haematococci]
MPVSVNVPPASSDHRSQQPWDMDWDWSVTNARLSLDTTPSVSSEKDYVFIPPSPPATPVNRKPFEMNMDDTDANVKREGDHYAVSADSSPSIPSSYDGFPSRIGDSSTFSEAAAANNASSFLSTFFACVPSTAALTTNLNINLNLNNITPYVSNLIPASPLTAASQLQQHLPSTATITSATATATTQTSLAIKSALNTAASYVPENVKNTKLASLASHAVFGDKNAEGAPKPEPKIEDRYGVGKDEARVVRGGADLQVQTGGNGVLSRRVRHGSSSSAASGSGGLLSPVTSPGSSPKSMSLSPGPLWDD